MRGRIYAARLLYAPSLRYCALSLHPRLPFRHALPYASPPSFLSQISDLQFLLEMFSRWQMRVFPHGHFDDFIQALEKMSSQSIVKVPTTHTLNPCDGVPRFSTQP